MYCKSLREAKSPDRVGGKAANLSRVSGLGFNTPNTIVIERSALRSFLRATSLWDRVAEYCDLIRTESGSALDDAFRELLAAVASEALPADMRQKLVEAVETLLEACPYGIAVRSSAVCEDSEKASFAGVFESYVGLVEVDAAIRAVIGCWCSAWSPKALRYMSRLAIEPCIDGMAVMLQELVPAEGSGVIYTADPGTGNPWQFILHATRGLSIDLMSGSGAGDRYCIDFDDLKITDRRIAARPVMVQATRAGLRRTEIRSPQARDPSATDTEIARVAGAARQLDDAFSMRLDIEWVIAQEKLWIVQVRPLTGLPPFFPIELDEHQTQQTWQPALFVFPLRADHPRHLLTPLYSDGSESELWYRYQPDDIVLTGFWKEGLDVNGYRYAALRRWETFQDYFEDPSEYEPWLEANEAGYRVRWDARSEEIERIARPAAAALRDTTTARELIPMMLMIRDRLWDLASFAWSGPQALGWMCHGALTDFLQRIDPSFRAESILAGLESHTFCVTRALQELARSIDEQPVRDAFERLPLDRVLPHLQDNFPGSSFLAKLESLCWRFGKNPPSWRDRPAFWSAGANDPQLMHTIKCTLTRISQDAVAIREAALRKRTADEQAMRTVVARGGRVAIRRFERLLDWTRYWTQALNDRHILAVGIFWERELVWETAARLKKAGLLDAPEDMLVLTRTDLEAIADSDVPASFRDLYRERKRVYRRNRRLVAPATFGKPAAEPPAAGVFAVDEQPDPPQADRSAAASAAPRVVTFEGQGFGGGRAVGRARQVFDLGPVLLDTLTRDDILVLPRAYAFNHADWHSLLVLVRGVVSPGSPSHHLAQVARECGIPLIGNVPADLTSIPDGAELRVDGGSGVVQLT